MTGPLASPRRTFIRRIVIDLSVMVGIGVFLGVIGPFGSIAAPIQVRVLSWVGFALLGYVFYRPMNTLVTWAQRALDLPRWGLLIATSLIATFPMTAAVMAIGSLPRAPVWPGLEVAMATYFSVLVIGGAVTLLFNIIGSNGNSSAPPATHPAAPLEDRVMAASTDQSAGLRTVYAAPKQSGNLLLDQLPAELGSDVIALEMEDHYVRVHTALGSDLVLMRMRDAMTHLAVGDGRQVHRSWWVARGAVEDVKREGRNVRLVLSGGIEAPVSRAQVSELKDAGWI
jgi:hypothetical protein